MIAGVLGTFFGGPLADRFGKKTIIVFSMLGSAPLALLLPHVSLCGSYRYFYVSVLLVQVVLV